MGQGCQDEGAVRHGECGRGGDKFNVGGEMNYYAVSRIERSCSAVLNGRITVPLSWADGMYGAMPVFTNKKLAKKYAGKIPLVMFVGPRQPREEEE